jgi:hypothetical protein
VRGHDRPLAFFECLGEITHPAELEVVKWSS